MLKGVWIAVLNGLNRLEICQKMVEAAMGLEEESAIGLIHDLGLGCLDEQEWCELKGKLEALVS